MGTKQMQSKLKTGDNAPDFTFDTPWEGGLKFYQVADGMPSVIIFLRYKGCPVCQLQMVDLRRDIDILKSRGAQVFVILQSSPYTVDSWTNKEDWPFLIICDPEGSIYQLYHVSTGNPIRLIHPAVLATGIKARFRGFKHGKFEGKETQLPAAFVIDRSKTICFAHYGKNATDVPKPAVLASYI